MLKTPSQNGEEKSCYGSWSKMALPKHFWIFLIFQSSWHGYLVVGAVYEAYKWWPFNIFQGTFMHEIITGAYMWRLDLLQGTFIFLDDAWRIKIDWVYPESNICEGIFCLDIFEKISNMMYDEYLCLDELPEEVSLLVYECVRTWELRWLVVGVARIVPGGWMSFSHFHFFKAQIFYAANCKYL